MIDVFNFERVGWSSRVALAQSVTLCLVLLNVINLSIPVIEDSRPFFFLMAVFYWSVYRPGFLPPALIFVYGILIDVLSGMPLGFNTLIYLIVNMIIRRQRLYLTGQPYLMVWLGFGLTCILAAALQNLLYLVAHGGVLPPLPPVISAAVISVIIFPVMSLLLHLTHRILSVDSKGGKVRVPGRARLG